MASSTKSRLLHRRRRRRIRVRRRRIRIWRRRIRVWRRLSARHRLAGRRRRTWSRRIWRIARARTCVGARASIAAWLGITSQTRQQQDAKHQNNQFHGYLKNSKSLIDTIESSTDTLPTSQTMGLMANLPRSFSVLTIGALQGFFPDCLRMFKMHFHGRQGFFGIRF